MGIGLTEDVARKESDIIAHVRIVTTTPASSSFPTTTDVSEHKTDSFSRVAIARVLTAVKGCKEGDTIKPAFDNGFGCPNVNYTEKEECLVFLKKSPEGPYHTMNLYCGRFTMEEGQVLYFYLMQPAGQPAKSVPLATALAWLREPPVTAQP